MMMLKISSKTKTVKFTIPNKTTEKKTHFARASSEVKISWWYNIDVWPVLLGESNNQISTDCNVFVIYIHLIYNTQHNTTHVERKKKKEK